MPDERLGTSKVRGGHFGRRQSLQSAGDACEKVGVAVAVTRFPRAGESSRVVRLFRRLVA
jgi:hypothetical protein